MSLRIDHYIHVDNPTFEKRVLDRLDQLFTRLTALEAKETQMAGELDALELEAKANTDAEQAAVTLLGQLHDMLAAALASGDTARIQAITDSLGTSKDALAAAIVANTPTA